MIKVPKTVELWSLYNKKIKVKVPKVAETPIYKYSDFYFKVIWQQVNNCIYEFILTLYCRRLSQEHVCTHCIACGEHRCWTQWIVLLFWSEKDHSCFQRKWHGWKSSQLQWLFDVSWCIRFWELYVEIMWNILPASEITYLPLFCMHLLSVECQMSLKETWPQVQLVLERI